jgi:hypothetical protein
VYPSLTYRDIAGATLLGEPVVRRARRHVLHHRRGVAARADEPHPRPRDLVRVVGVIQGVEHEELFDEQLNLVGVNDNRVGEVSGFAPPGDFHRVHNTGDVAAMSIHIYGTDVTRIGSSVRRYTTDEASVA